MIRQDDFYMLQRFAGTLSRLKLVHYIKFLDRMLYKYNGQQRF